ncbi:MAG: hypothetical protein H7X95_05720, partial [Deltaproteobacteria bacterium]|nr:hypothetical protein [Deltaproteobacteria bacterium]
MSPTPHAVSAVRAHDYCAEWTTVSCGALVLAVVSPLGLASGVAADQVAHAFGERRPFDVATPLADVLVRFFSVVPVGEAGMRAHGVAALAGLLALALMLVHLRPLSREGGTVAVVGMALLTLSRPFLEIATIRPAEAVDFCLLMAIALLLQLIRRDPAHSSVGLGLAFVCGLAAGAGWPLRVAAWPCALILTLWAFRRGERWPLLAPTLFLAGTGVTLAAAAAAQIGTRPPLGVMLRRMWLPTSPFAMDLTNARQIVAWVIDDTGVLGLLVGGIGLGLILARQRRQTLLW